MDQVLIEPTKAAVNMLLMDNYMCACKYYECSTYQLSPHDAAWLSVKEMATSLRKFLWLRDWNNS